MNQEPSKILFCITKGTWGGAQRYVHELAVSLPKTDFTPFVVAGSSGELLERCNREQIQTRIVSSMCRDVSLLSDVTAVVELCRVFSDEKPRVVHLNSSKASGIGKLPGRMADGT